MLSRKFSTPLAPLGLLLCLATLAACDLESFRGFPSDKPPIHPVLDMDFQPKVRAQSKSDFAGFADHRGARRPVSDAFGNTLVVARGSLPDPALSNRDANGQYVTKNPLPLSYKFHVRGREMSTIDRGQELFEIHCAPCHGLSGRGGSGPAAHGTVGRSWLIKIPNFHFSAKEGADNRVANMPDGEYFETITTGKGTTMPPYGARIEVAERWAIVHYVRALQSLSK